jgi:putative ABC transport system permease protein
MTEVRTTWRQLLRAPAHVATVVASLGIGMAVCGAMFSALNMLLFSDVPGVVDRNGVVRIRWAGQSASFTPAEFEALATTMAGHTNRLAAQGERLVPIVLGGEAASARAAFVSPALFETLGTQPLRGRLLTRADARPGAAPVVVIAEPLWHRAFDGDPGAIGRSLRVRGRPSIVVGIVPTGFGGLRLDMGDGPEHAPEVWLPLDGDAPHRPWLSIAARLQPGETPSDVQVRLAVIADRLDRVSPPEQLPARLQVFRGGLDWRQSTWDSLLATGLFLMVPLAVLGIACANVVNLQLARAADRTRELSVRLTLGASRWRVIRLLALEVVVLGIAAAAVGGVGAALLLAQASRLVGLALFLDTSVIGFFAVLVVVVVAAAGLVPGWMASRDLVAVGLRVAPDALVLTRLRAALVVFQLAVSVVLLFVATLAVKTLRADTRTLPADAASILVAEIEMAEARHDAPIHPKPFIDATVAVLRESDAIRAVGAASFDRHGSPMRYWTEEPGADGRPASVGLVTAGWFDATDTRLAAGRTFADDERSAIVVNEALADALGPRPSVLGRQLRVSVAGGPPRPVTISGIVDDTTPRALPMAYLAMASDVPRYVVLTARARDAASGRDAVRAALKAADPAVPRDRIVALDRKVADASRGYERTVGMVAAIAALAVILAAAGLFALLSFMVRRRTREIGIRVALGASRVAVLSMVVRQALSLAVAGCTAGLSIALGVGYVARAAVFGVSPLAPTSVLPTVGLLVGVSVLASLPTAWRALRIEPAVALRDE